MFTLSLRNTHLYVAFSRKLPPPWWVPAAAPARRPAWWQRAPAPAAPTPRGEPPRTAPRAPTKTHDLLPAQ